VEDIDFGVDFVAENSNKLPKLGLEGKISWTLNVFTLCPTTQVTLVLLDKERRENDATLQNFIYKYILNLENVQNKYILDLENVQRIYKTSNEFKLNVKISPNQKLIT